MAPRFEKNTIREKFGRETSYSTTRPGNALFPSLKFYCKTGFGPFRWLAVKAANNQCDDSAWVYGSAWVGDILESCGCRIVIDGLDNLGPGPVVYVANHMSTLETFLLPAILRPAGKVTFVVKQSLVEMPLFGAIMRSRNPVAVERKNPREDLKKVLQDGTRLLQGGCSLVIFPQSTRSPHFDREHFNSMGVKLGRHAEVPVIPIALKTDAWGLGRHIAEFGQIRPNLPIHFKIGKAMQIKDTGRDQHKEICDFIESALLDWQKEDGWSQ